MPQKFIACFYYSNKNLYRIVRSFVKYNNERFYYRLLIHSEKIYSISDMY